MSSIRAVGAVAMAAAALCALPIAPAAAESSWYELAEAPFPRQEVSYVVADRAAYLAGGNDRAQDRYDIRTDSWRPVARLPAAFESVDHVAGVAVGDEIVYAGGLLRWEYPFPTTGAVALYDTSGDSFSPGTEMPAPRGAGGVAAWHGLAIYAGGLGPEGSVSRVDAYDPRADTWTRLQDMPRARDHFQLVVADGSLYAIGGRLTTGSPGKVHIAEIGTVDKLDLPEDTADLADASWTADVTALPAPRGGLGVAAVGDCIYAAGGESTSIAAPGVTGVTESYDTDSGTWRELPQLAIPRHGIEAAVSGETILIAGGGTESFADSPTAVQEALDVRGSPPCTARDRTSSTPPPPVEPTVTADSDESTGTESGNDVHVLRLSVRPRRVPPRAQARAVLFLPQAETVRIRAQRFVFGQWIPTAVHLDRRLHAGRNVVALHLADDPLLAGRYRLLAVPQTATLAHAARTGFRIVP